MWGVATQSFQFRLTRKHWQESTEHQASLSLKLWFLLPLLLRTAPSSRHLLLVSSAPPLILFLSSHAGLYYTFSPFLYSTWSSNLVTLIPLTWLYLIIWSLLFFLFQSLSLCTVESKICIQAMQGVLRQQRPHIMESRCGFLLFQGPKNKTIPAVNHGSAWGGKGWL